MDRINGSCEMNVSSCPSEVMFACKGCLFCPSSCTLDLDTDLDTNVPCKVTHGWRKFRFSDRSRFRSTCLYHEKLQTTVGDLLR